MLNCTYAKCASSTTHRMRSTARSRPPRKFAKRTRPIFAITLSRRRAPMSQRMKRKSPRRSLLWMIYLESDFCLFDILRGIGNPPQVERRYEPVRPPLDRVHRHCGSLIRTPTSSRCYGRASRQPQEWLPGPTGPPEAGAATTITDPDISLLN